jgi:hypothetical protein
MAQVRIKWQYPQRQETDAVVHLARISYPGSTHQKKTGNNSSQNPGGARAAKKGIFALKCRADCHVTPDRHQMDMLWLGVLI